MAIDVIGKLLHDYRRRYEYEVDRHNRAIEGSMVWFESEARAKLLRELIEELEEETP